MPDLPSAEPINDALDLAFFNALVSTASRTLDRTRNAAEAVQKAAAAIGTIYASGLAVLAASGAIRIDALSFLPSVFLAIALVASTMPLVLIRKAPKRPGMLAWPQEPADRLLAHAAVLIDRANSAALNGVTYLYVAVAALGAGVFLLPAPLLEGSRRRDASTAALRALQPPWPKPPGSKASASSLALYRQELGEVATARARGALSHQVLSSPAVLAVAAAGAALVVAAACLGRHTVRQRSATSAGEVDAAQQDI